MRSVIFRGDYISIGLPIMAFLLAYPKASEGLEKLKEDIQKRFKKREGDLSTMEINFSWDDEKFIDREDQDAELT